MREKLSMCSYLPLGVNAIADIYYGGTELYIKEAFSIARESSPCIINFGE